MHLQRVYGANNFVKKYEFGIQIPTAHIRPNSLKDPRPEEEGKNDKKSKSKD